MPAPSVQLADAQRLFQAGRFEDAETAARDVLRGDRKSAPAHQLLGMIAASAGDFEAAVRWMEKAQRLDPDSPSIVDALARVQVMQGKFDRAVRTYERARRKHSRDITLITGLAEVLERKGETEPALALLEPVLPNAGNTPEICSIHGLLLHRLRRDAEAVDILRKALAIGDQQPQLRTRMLYTLGRSLDRLDASDDAFEAFREANETSNRSFDVDAMRADVDQVIEVFSPDRMSSFAQSSNDTELPVFIVGMPRCGSTLLEQVLAAHPEVAGAGEVNALARVAEQVPAKSNGVGYPAGVTQLDTAALDALGGPYLATLKRIGRTAKRVTDKSLNNFGFLGLMAMLFPRARVIHCRRDPVATCFSCYTNALSATMYPFATNLETLGGYFVQYDRLMCHWKTVLDQQMLEVRYEDVIEEFEMNARRMIDFCGLEWNDACAQFHESDRAVATLSYDQVRQPIYRAAVSRHERYASHLEPLRRVLDEAGLLDESR